MALDRLEADLSSANSHQLAGIVKIGLEQYQTWKGRMAGQTQGQEAPVAHGEGEPVADQPAAPAASVGDDRVERIKARAARLGLTLVETPSDAVSARGE